MQILQAAYDDGLSLIELSEKYKIPKTFLSKNIDTRDLSEASALARKKYPERFQPSEETREKMRRSHFEYLKKKTGNTPWERRQRGEMSYLEQWFYDECIIKHDLVSKYDIVNEHGVYPYFIDFAFLNMKLAVELDGKCHFDKGGKRIAHDIKRDKYLNNKGWSVYRIRYDQQNDVTIAKFLEFLDGVEPEPKVYGNRLYERCEVVKKKNKKNIKKPKTKSTTKRKTSKKKAQKRTRDEYHEEARAKYLESQQQYVDLVLDSGIDFSAYGWAGQVAEIIGQRSQKVTQWMRRVMPEFYEENCFKRRGTK